MHRGELTTTLESLPIQCFMGMGGEKEGEGIVPSPRYYTNMSPFKGSRPPQVL